MVSDAYPQYSLNLTGVPNGGLRGKAEAAIMKAEGMTAGAAALLLLVPRGGFGVLGIEFKTPAKEWAKRGAEAATGGI